MKATATRGRVDALGIEKNIRWWQYLGDAQGLVVNGLVSGMVGLLTYFYTDKVGMAAGTAALAILLAKVFDSFTDLIMGPIVDRTRTRWGKARPWFLFMALPAGVSLPLMFMIPAGAGGAFQFAWAVLTNAFATSVVMTALMIPYGVLLVYSTRSPAERTAMSIWRAVFSFIAGAIVAIMAVPMANMLGGTQDAWIKLAVIFGVLATIASLLVFFTARERFDDEGAERQASDVPYLEGLSFLFRNKHWVLLLIVNLMASIGYALGGAGGVYYAKWILGDENLVGLLGAVGFLPFLIGFAIIGPLSKRFGITNIIRVGLVLAILASVVRSFNPYSLELTLATSFFSGLGLVPMMVSVGVLTSFIAEYNELHFGNNLAGLNASATGFGSKLSAGLGAALIGWLLALGAYDPNLPAQGQGAINAILAFSIWVPGALALVELVALHWFDLEKHYPSIVGQLAERRAAAQGVVVASAEGATPVVTADPAVSDHSDPRP